MVLFFGHGSIYIFIYLYINIYIFSFLFADEPEFYKHTLRLAQGNGVVGRIYFTGCVHGSCFYSFSFKVTMIVRARKGEKIREKSFHIVPSVRPFPVDGYLNLQLTEKDVLVEVLLNTGRDEHQLMRGKTPA